MKKLNIILLVFLVIGLESCNNWLDLKPESEVVLEDYWQTESQATAVLAAGYRGLISDGCMERMIVWGELRSDNMVAGKDPSDAVLKVLDVNITPTNAFADWSSFYSVINYCNTFLYYAPSVVNKDQNFTPTKLHTMEAEALTLRALSYFYLVRAFHEVPLILNPSISDAQNYKVPKSSERVILDQIIADLLIAKQSAKTSYGSEKLNKGRITLNAVNSLLADVYLWDQQYANCAEMCNQVLADKTLKLVQGEKVTTNVFYTGNSTESIFELQFDINIQYNNSVRSGYGIYDQQAGALAYPLYFGSKGTFSPFKYQPATLNESADDVRESNTASTFENGSGYYIFKYVISQLAESLSGIKTPIYRTSSTTPNWIVYRLSDVILMRAEALAQLGSNDNLKESVKLVNTTYLRSNITSDSLSFEKYGDKVSVQDLVLRERQRELMFEGKRWFDLMRLVRRTNSPSLLLKYIGPKLTGDVMKIQKMSVMNALYMPILQSELQINTSLTQNPFYVDTDLTSN